MIRERKLVTLAFAPGARTQTELPKDAVYHQLQLSLSGQVSSVNAAGSSANTFYQGFPFSLMDNIRVIRNGSDVVWQGSGKMLAKECFYLNKRHPHARLFTAAQALLTSVVNGLTVPSNSEGIGENAAKFQDAGTASSTVITNFEALAEIWFQLGSVDEKWYTTLLDARPLASFVIEITWAQVASVLVPGTAATVSIINTVCNVLSYDQDGVKPGQQFGTYKRSQQNISQATYGSSGIQYLLSRGNLWQGILFETLAYKAGSASIPEPEQNVISEFFNRINVNYFLRNSGFQDLQRKALQDAGIPTPFQTQSSSPRGIGYLNFLGVGDRASELVQSYTMDQFDLSLNISTLAAAENGTTTAGTQPVINILTQEVIPGKGVSPNTAQGSQAGSIAKTNAQPYRVA